jgi:hypothetical protein
LSSKDQIRSIADALGRASETTEPALGLSLDGVINQAPSFFKFLASKWPGPVFVISSRHDRNGAEKMLAEFEIQYDELILVDSFDAKAKAIVEKGIAVYFDDQPVMLKNIPPAVNVMLVRNGGNFDFEGKKWLFSEQTGRIVGPQDR